MGICGSQQSLTLEEVNIKKTSQQLDDKLIIDKRAGESGKSTLFKQAIALYGKGYNETELRDFIPIITNNVLFSIKTLVRYAGSEISHVTISNSNLNARTIIDEASINSLVLSPEVASSISVLWADEGIQAAYSNRSKYQLNDSTEYFMERFMAIQQPNYVPDAQDVLRSRVRTTGIIETSFSIDDNTFKMYDVGGQRNERKKWIHCFENVTAVLFVAALSEYDQVLFEDESTNRMVEALNLFDEICNSRWFCETSMILFLNKEDLFAEKVKKVSINVCPSFSNYTGPNEYVAASEYITLIFESLNRHADTKAIYTHLTCVTNTQNIKVVLHDVQDIIIRNILINNGLI